MQPYYDDGTCTIYHGDYWPLLPDLSADVMIADPPYGFGAYPTDRAPAPDLLTDLIGKHHAAAVFGYPELLVAWCVATEVVPDEWVTWWPTNKPAGRGNSLPRSSEHIAIFGETPGIRALTRERSEQGGRAIAARWGTSPQVQEGDVWRDPSPGVMFNAHLRLHPNEKPVSLMAKLVQLCSLPGDLILDPFMGSGTTLRAAKDLGRKAIGIEIEERYCEIAAKRLGQEVLDLSGVT